MARLGISQVSGSSPAQFVVQNYEKQRLAQPAAVPSPYEWPVPNAGDEKLMTQLRWYLEQFLNYPFEPNIARAKFIEEALKAWGTAAFNALFNNLEAGAWIPQRADAVLDLMISCDDPHFLAWPWEALHFPPLGFLGHRARIQRRLSREVPDPPDLPELPTDCIHILLITARPYGEDDVDYRSISRPLVELIGREKLPVAVHALRPPTLENLRRHLDDNPGHYHILHFDGHGGYEQNEPAAVPNYFKGNEGRLLFEKKDGSADDVTASRLATLLKGCAIPFVVLNACRSAQLDANAAEGSAFASVAGGLVHAGFRGVLAMAYNLTVTGAREFLPAFYRRLFRSGNLLEAAREGRLRMFEQGSRSAWNRDVSLQDWLLPVVYQQSEDFDLKFSGARPAQADTVPLPAQALVPEALSFIGRDSAIHAIERAMRKPAASILVHGLGGIGKTTLARQFLQWLRDTGGLEREPLWFSFDDIRSASFVFNEIGHSLFGPQFDGDDQATHFTALIEALREQPLLLVWDNFESARGFEPDHVSGCLSAADAQRLGDFLRALRGGKTRVLITSRSDEPWLPPEDCRRVALAGLQGEELWEYAAQVLEILDLPADREDTELRKLLSDLGGHPVLVRAVLAQLSGQSSASLRAQWKEHLPRFLTPTADPAHARLLASLEVALASFGPQEKPYLIPLGLHERYVDLNYLHAMGNRGIPGYEPAKMEAVIARLVRAGFLSGLGHNIFSLHPLFTSSLRATTPGAQKEEALSAETVAGLWERAFVDVMGSLANAVAPKELHEQRGIFAFHHTNFYRALDLAMAHGIANDTAALTQSLAIYAQNTRNWREAAALFDRLAENGRQTNNPEGEAGAYHHLGMIAQEQHDLGAAECRYLKALAIFEKHGNEHSAASSYLQLGSIALLQHDLGTAECRYLKALAIFEKHGNEHAVAISYHHLGSIALLQHDLGAGECRYLKALAIFEKHGNEHGAASSYLQLGSIALLQHDLGAAERWYFKSLAIFEKYGNEHNAAMNYHQLGMIAEEQRDFGAAERWYLKALAIFEKQGNEHDAASTYHQLGMIAEEQRDFGAAERWYLKALAIKEKQGNEHDAASTYHQLGMIAEEQRDFGAAERWYLKSLAITENHGDEYGAAISYHQLGIIAQEQRDFDAAERWYLKSLAIKEKQGNEHGAAISYGQLGHLARERGDYLQAGRHYLKALGIFSRKNDAHSAGIASNDFARLFASSSPAAREPLGAMGREALGDDLMAQIIEAANSTSG
ncbi:MAG: hypothetical protein JWL59_4350 [Chthoniobacteraceae bacterium]|nr:hypothetical protein [Chthoniobacteraceae bacterium]